VPQGVQAVLPAVGLKELAAQGWQTMSVPDHVRSAWQVRVVEPDDHSLPELQVYVAVSWKAGWLGWLTTPLAGLAKGAHWLRTQVGAAEEKDPDAWQVGLAVPESVNPELQE
jgi:hypothetical protein